MAWLAVRELRWRLLREAMFYESIGDSVVRCRLCPRECVIAVGKRGFCGVRENRDGVLYALNYGLVTAFAVDPVEKKPFYHWYPGSPILSISTMGCNFKCPWCQNHDISQNTPEEVYSRFVEPREVVDYAVSRRIPLIAFTYNEPIIWYEYVYEVARLAKREGLKCALVTNGYINLEPLRELAPYIDAANVDIKAFSEEAYRRYPMAELQKVLDSVKEMKRRGWHVETTYLVVPRVNDSADELRAYAEWHVSELGEDTPFHVSRFFPMFKFTHVPPTPVEKLEEAWRIARDAGVRYVYVGNLPGHEGEHTYCPGCGRVVIKRMGFEITEWHLDDNNCCEFCGIKIAVVGRRYRGGSFALWL